MKNPTIALVITISATTSACSHNLVKSNRSNLTESGQGIIYSLPKQLVNLSYTRKSAKASEAEQAVSKIKKEIDALNKRLAEIVAKEKLLTETISNVDPKATNKLEVVTKANLELTTTKAEKLTFQKSIQLKTNELLSAHNAYHVSLENKDAFIETIKLAPEKPIPDTSNTYIASIMHNRNRSDSLEISVSNGLLSGAVGFSDDKSSDIFVTLVGGLSGISTYPSAISTQAYASSDSAGDPQAEGPLLCRDNPENKKAININQVFDPADSRDIESLNIRLKKACMYVSVFNANNVDTTSLSNESTKNVDSADGLVYRQPGVLKFKFFDIDTDDELFSHPLVLAQSGDLAVLPFKKGYFAKNEYEVEFVNGMLKRSKFTYPSEILGAVSIIPNTLKAIVSIPAEIIKLRVDYSTSDKALLELKKSMIETQLEIDKLILSITDTSAAPNSPE